jgi:hypothetical protein
MRLAKAITRMSEDQDNTGSFHEIQEKSDFCSNESWGNKNECS